MDKGSAARSEKSDRAAVFIMSTQAIDGYIIDNDQTTTKTLKKPKAENTLSLVLQRIADFLHMVETTGLEPVTSCV